MKALPPGSTLRKLLYRSFRTTPELPLRFRRRFTLPGIFVWCLITLTVFLGLDTTQTTAYQIVTLLFAMMMVGLVCTLFFKPRIRIRRVLPTLGTVGQTLNYELRLTNENRLPERGLIAIENLEDPRPTLTEFLFTPEPGEERPGFLPLALALQSETRRHAERASVAHPARARGNRRINDHHAPAARSVGLHRTDAGPPRPVRHG
jgi:hypothetical protein